MINRWHPFLLVLLCLPESTFSLVFLLSCVPMGTRAAQAAETHWAYRPIARPMVPEVASQPTHVNPIDPLVSVRLATGPGMSVEEADRTTLIRRLTLDLTGLPPTPAEVREFVDDTQPTAYQRLVDRLLASPHYGEHWARPWLDLCHYADSDGYLTDQARPVAWRYRDWLVDALNDGISFDQFTIHQLAGDLLPGAGTDQKLATGFLRQTLSNREGGADPVEFRNKQVIDRTSMVGEIWMGLTVGCAECHDHKYDDLSQREFYQLYAFMNSADEVNVDAPLPSERDAYQDAVPEYQRKRNDLVAPLRSEIDALQQRWEQKLLHAREHPGEDWFWDRQWELLGLVWGGGLGEGQLEGWQIIMLEPAKRSQLQRDRLLDYFLGVVDTVDAAKAKELNLTDLRNEIAKLKADLPVVTRAATMMQTQNPRLTFIHNAGDFRDLGDEVQPSTPRVLPSPNDQSGDRLSLAKWLVSSEHPLTARVAVNRIWQQFFGHGIVATPGDFGVRGAPPTNPELLDWLASEFIAGGWCMKSMHRKIVMSGWYRRGQQPSLRLTAEQIRDSILMTSGLWDAKIGGPSVKPYQSDSVTAEGYGNEWKISDGGDLYRRGIYTWIQRTSPFAMHITFDAPNPNHICTQRDRSNTPLQALTLLNDPVIQQAAQSLASRVFRECNGDDQQRIGYAFRLCLARDPSPQETRVLIQLLQQLQAENRSPDQQETSASSTFHATQETSWTVLCSLMFNLHEFVTRN